MTQNVKRRGATGQKTAREGTDGSGWLVCFSAARWYLVTYVRLIGIQSNQISSTGKDTVAIILSR